MVSQQRIDACGYAGDEVINIDPMGGGVDVIYSVDILSEIRSNPYSKRMIQWKASDSVPDAIPGESAHIHDDVHFVGVPRANDERIAFVECTETGDYALAIPSFSEISDEVAVHRVWCAALRPTDTDFTFSNPIKNITVTASPDTVNLQVVALDEYKTVTAGNSITVTHTQDFPCVFGIIYKHKAKGEVADSGTQPEPTATVLQQSFSFQPSENINYLERSFDAGGRFTVVGNIATRIGGIQLQKMTLKTPGDNVQCNRLCVTEINAHNRKVTHNVVTDTDNLMTGNDTALATLVNHAGISRLAGTVNIEITLPACLRDVVLTIYYTQLNE